MTAPAEQAASVVNRRQPTKFMALVEDQVPKPHGTDAPRPKRHTEDVKNQGGGSGGRSSVKEKLTGDTRPSRRAYALAPKAMAFGKKILFNYKRIKGVLENGARNRKWVVAVCRWIARQPKTPKAKGKWAQDIEATRGYESGSAKVKADRMMDNRTR